MRSVGLAVVLAASVAPALACDRSRSVAVDSSDGGDAGRGSPSTLPNKLAKLEAKPAPRNALSDLGRVLFFDERLSGDNSMSCATCHVPGKGFADGLPLGKGHNGKTLPRNTPSLVNVDARAPFFWDGRSPTAEEQALGPMMNPDEMAQDPAELVKELEEAPEYVARFSLAFGDPKITVERSGKALAEFERTLVSANAPIDRWFGGDKSALGAAAQRGLALFTGKAECVKCHDGPHFTDASFHNIGIKGSDPGRFKILDLPLMKGAFKTPGLRDVALTAPYFHDGSAPTLLAVVEHYDRGGDVKDNLDRDIHPLSLTAAEKQDLVAFMEALSGEPIALVPPRSPRVNRSPRNVSTRTLMKSADGMLDGLDRLVARLEENRWDDARASVAMLLANNEELATLRARTVKPDRLSELRLLIGKLGVAFQDLDSALVVRSRARATAAYEEVRSRCEDCHDAFRGARPADAGRRP